MTNSPVVLRAGALSEDTKEKRLLIQLKFKRISAVSIRRLGVLITLFDSEGASLGTPVSFVYDSAEVERDCDFGNRSPIFITDTRAVSFSVKLDKVELCDGRTLDYSSLQWKPLVYGAPIKRVYKDPYCRRGYRCLFGEGARRVLSEQGSLWICSCGSVNDKSEESCHSCGASLLAQREVSEEILRSEGIYNEACRLSALDTVGDLKRANSAFSHIPDFRDSSSKIEENEARIKSLNILELERAERKKRRIKRVLLAIGGAAIIIVIALAILTFTVFIPGGRYNDAVTDYNRGRYESAYESFMSLGNYSDSRKYIGKIRDVAVDKAEELADKGDYAGAISVLDKYGATGLKKAYSCMQERDYLGAINNGLDKIVISDGIKTIKMGAFANAKAFTSLTIPSSVTAIRVDAFKGCGGIDSLYIESLESWLNINFSNEESNPMKYAENVYIAGEKVDKLVIPQNITEIKSFAFSGCNSLSLAELHGSVEKIGYNSFANCPELSGVNIPLSVTVIADNAFLGSDDALISVIADEKPSGWSNDWCAGGCEVIWGARDGKTFESAKLLAYGEHESVILDIPGEEIYYKFVPDTSATYVFRALGECDTYATLYNSEESLLEYDDDDGDGINFKIAKYLAEGEIYYLKVRLYSSSRTGTFVIIVE